MRVVGGRRRFEQTIASENKEAERMSGDGNNEDSNVEGHNSKHHQVRECRFDCSQHCKNQSFRNVFMVCRRDEQSMGDVGEAFDES